MIEWHTERNKHHQVTNNIGYCHQAKKISTALWVSRRTGSPVDFEPWSSVFLPSCLFVTTHCAASVVILRAPESVGWTLRFWRRASTTRALVHSTKQDNHIKSHPIYLVTIAFVLYVCMHVCVYACMDVRMPIHNVHMSVCMYVWVYVCMYDAARNPPKCSVFVSRWRGRVYTCHGRRRKGSKLSKLGQGMGISGFHCPTIICMFDGLQDSCASQLRNWLGLADRFWHRAVNAKYEPFSTKPTLRFGSRWLLFDMWLHIFIETTRHMAGRTSNILKMGQATVSTTL